ncbi:uncharacterized protein LOC126891399 [Diabrotica virgifera virgifera]|uniref:Endonuclease/exonuclease/phosphatase domain-containing protein n=1 Tax=Diabrotica virgifera virgifera TaxID=50390 RepID=A0ABM5L262_DIAVI|nr:uncharacterized protein LOC126891399 [Diabrotica virgifera virgifera]
MVDCIMENHEESVWLCGDFNMPYCTWSTEDFCSVPVAEVGERNHSSDVVTLLADSCAFHNLYQVNEVPNNTDRILDLILSTNKNTSVTLSDHPLVPADRYHPPLNIQIKTNTNHTNEDSPQNDIFYYDFKSADLTLLNDCLSQINWDELLLNHSVNNMVNIFYDILYFFVHAVISQKKVSKRKFPLWFTPELKQLTIQKKQAHKRLKNSGLRGDYVDYSILRAECKNLSQLCYLQFVEKSEFSLTDQRNIKQFWNFVKSKRSGNELPPLLFFKDKECSKNSNSEKKLNSSGTSHIVSGELTVYYQNVRGIRTKLTALEESAATTDYDVLIFTESWLCDGISNDELGLLDFNIYRKDRSPLTSDKVIGGGVLIAVKKCYSSRSILLPHVHLEELFVEVCTLNECYIFGTVYLPPNSALISYENHCISIESVCNNFPEHKFILTGDYNLPNSEWYHDKRGVFSNNSNTATDTLVDTFAFYNLFQLNHITNCNGVLLDLVFANDNENVTVEIANDYLLPCDRYHPALSISLAIKDNMPELQYDSFAFNFRRGDYVALNMYLASISWENVLGICSDINEATELFYSILQFGIHCSIPRVRLKIPNFLVG